MPMNVVLSFQGSAKHIHHPFDNPPILSRNASSEEDILTLYRRVRDEIKEFVKKMPEILV